MYQFLNKWTRKLHRWGAVATVLPLLLVIGTGLLLQVKKQWSWVQPPTASGEFTDGIALARILEIAAADPQAGIRSWDDVDRLDVRPGKGIVKVRGKGGWEVQVDLAGERIVQTEVRRSDWIESLHDGSYFGDSAKLTVFLANGFILLGLWVTGCYLWYLPFWAKARSRARARKPAA